MFQPTPTVTPATPLPITLCVVTNVLDAKVERIIDLCSTVCAEILIGYDNQGKNDFAGFTENRHTTIMPLSWEGYAATKNKLAEKARHDWILSLDSDEIPDEKLLAEIAKLHPATLPEHQMFYFKRVSILGNYKILFGSWGSDKVLRLYNRKHSAWKNEKVHESLLRHSNSKLIRLRGVLHHYTVADYGAYVAKNKKYARLSAEKYYAQGKTCPVWKIWLKTAFTFIKEYILQLGILDGRIGLRLALGNARYTYWKYTYLREKYQSSASPVNTFSN